VCCAKQHQKTGECPWMFHLKITNNSDNNTSGEVALSPGTKRGRVDE
jgi:hypothetical protein